MSKQERLELRHDILAEKIWRKLPEQDRSLRQAKASLAQRQADFAQGRGGLLRREELDTYRGLMGQLSPLLTDEQRQYYQDSRKARQRRRVLLWLGVGLAFSAAILVIVVVRQEQRKTENARKQAEATLAEVQRKNLSIFESFAALGKNQIYALDHAEALEKMKVAVEIDVDSKLKKQQLIEPIAELLYFFAEGGRRPELARTAASLLLQLQPSATLEAQLEKCLQESWKNRSQFTPLLKALQSYQTLQDRYYPRMVSIPLGEAGIFEMGSSPSESGHQSDEQLHKVRLSPYQMAETPTTFYQFALFCEAVERGVARRAPYWGLRGDHPAVNVNWYEAAEYANWLNEQNGQSPSYTITKIANSDRNNRVRLDFLKWKVDWNEDSKGFRLPTEAEWELAARGGAGAPRKLYAGSDDLEEVGWYWQNSGDKPLDGDWDLNRIYDNNGRTHAVKGKKHNGLGIYDLSGNVFEWCWDWYGSDYYDECNQEGAVEKPTGPESSTNGRVFRSGSWFNRAVYCRTARRFNFDPDGRRDYIGFRLVFVLQ